MGGGRRSDTRTNNKRKDRSAAIPLHSQSHMHRSFGQSLNINMFALHDKHAGCTVRNGSQKKKKKKSMARRPAVQRAVKCPVDCGVHREASSLIAPPTAISVQTAPLVPAATVSAPQTSGAERFRLLSLRPPRPAASPHPPPHRSARPCCSTSVDRRPWCLNSRRSLEMNSPSDETKRSTHTGTEAESDCHWLAAAAVLSAVSSLSRVALLCCAVLALLQCSLVLDSLVSPRMISRVHVKLCKTQPPSAALIATQRSASRAAARTASRMQQQQQQPQSAAASSPSPPSAVPQPFVARWLLTDEKSVNGCFVNDIKGQPM